MKLTIKKQVWILSVLTVCALNACSSGNEDDATLEMKEPVEAVAVESAAPEANPSSSVAIPAAAAETSSAPGTAPVAMPSAGSAMNTSRRVMYVKVDGAVVREKAEPKAKVVGKLEKGDHLLVTLEGDWARTDDGKFISAKVLSEKGIGRDKKDATWSGGAAKQVGAAKKSEPMKTDESKSAPAKKDVKKDEKSTVKPEATKPAATEGGEAPQP